MWNGQVRSKKYQLLETQTDSLVGAFEVGRERQGPLAETAEQRFGGEFVKGS